VEDFPLWFKLVIWLTVLGTIGYAVGMMIYSWIGG
jgi:hypothetical protein